MAAGSAGASRSAGKKTILGTVSLYIFILTLILAAGTFGYERYLVSRLGTMGTDLESARQNLKPETIRELVRMDSRIISTDELLKRHTTITPIFKYLEESTLKAVRFNALDYTTTARGVELSMKGQARGYSAVALQSEIFNNSKFLKNPVFSDLDLDSKGNVTFSFKATVDPSFISYKPQVTSSQRTAPVMTATSTPTSPSGFAGQAATSSATSTPPTSQGGSAGQAR